MSTLDVEAEIEVFNKRDMLLTSVSFRYTEDLIKKRILDILDIITFVRRRIRERELIVIRINDLNSCYNRL